MSVLTLSDLEPRLDELGLVYPVPNSVRYNLPAGSILLNAKLSNSMGGISSRVLLYEDFRDYFYYPRVSCEYSRHRSASLLFKQTIKIVQRCGSRSV